MKERKRKEAHETIKAEEIEGESERENRNWFRLLLLVQNFLRAAAPIIQ